MRAFLAQIKKELRLYFYSPIAYIFYVVFLAFSYWIFFQSFFDNGAASLGGYFAVLPWLYFFILPSLTMRIWAEEFRQGTDEVLLTSSLSSLSLVLSKFVASFIVFEGLLFFSLSLPVSLFFIGDFDWGMVMTSYMGASFLGMAFLAIGQFFSSVTHNQIIAFIMTVISIFFLYFLSHAFVLYKIPNTLVPFFQSIGSSYYYNSFLLGTIDSRAVVYFLSVISFFLYITYEKISYKK
ncbi:ABC transporter [Candidatus Peregrinibacteria bacterium]|nr:MAG: ABC transporter [Candidatus Peregrinibacteria bacterium]